MLKCDYESTLMIENLVKEMFRECVGLISCINLQSNQIFFLLVSYSLRLIIGARDDTRCMAELHAAVFN